MKRFRFSLLVLSIFLMSQLLSCKTGRHAASWTPSTDEYAFVEYYVTMDGRALEGEPPPSMRIHGPTYSFNSEQGEVYSFRENMFNLDTLVLLVGRGMVRRGTQGGGMHSQLVATKSLPLELEQLEIFSLHKERIQFKWKDEEFSLAYGESWAKEFVSLDTFINHVGDTVIVENTTSHSVVFHGLLKKKDIRFN